MERRDFLKTAIVATATPVVALIPETKSGPAVMWVALCSNPEVKTSGPDVNEYVELQKSKGRKILGAVLSQPSERWSVLVSIPCESDEEAIRLADDILRKLVNHEVDDNEYGWVFSIAAVGAGQTIDLLRARYEYDRIMEAERDHLLSIRQRLHDVEMKLQRLETRETKILVDGAGL